MVYYTTLHYTILHYTSSIFYCLQALPLGQVLRLLARHRKPLAQVTLVADEQPGQRLCVLGRRRQGYAGSRAEPEARVRVRVREQPGQRPGVLGNGARDWDREGTEIGVTMAVVFAPLITAEHRDGACALSARSPV